MIDVNQFRQEVVRPVITALGLYSRAAENLLVGTALQESGLKYLRQLNGPAIGVLQMENPTHDDIWANYLTQRHGLATLVRGFQLSYWEDVPAAQMAGNMYYAVAMGRIHYLRVREALPKADNAAEMARYWKKYYNTLLGRGTVEGALPHFQMACQ